MPQDTPEAKRAYLKEWRKQNKQRVVLANKEYYQRNKKQSAERGKRFANSPRGKYVTQRCRAKARNIGWLFTFESWIAWWGTDYAKRGLRTDQLCMCRRGDTGPYSPENCYKDSAPGNAAYARELRMCSNG